MTDTNLIEFDFQIITDGTEVIEIIPHITDIEDRDLVLLYIAFKTELMKRRRKESERRAKQPD